MGGWVRRALFLLFLPAQSFIHSFTQSHLNPPIHPPTYPRGEVNHPVSLLEHLALSALSTRRGTRNDDARRRRLLLFFFFEKGGVNRS